MNRPAGRPASRTFSTAVERTSRGLVHCVAECRVCAWNDNNHLNAARRATAHVRKTGHEVAVDQGIVYTARVKKTKKEAP